MKKNATLLWAGRRRGVAHIIGPLNVPPHRRDGQMVLAPPPPTHARVRAHVKSLGHTLGLLHGAILFPRLHHLAIAPVEWDIQRPCVPQTFTAAGPEKSSKDRMTATPGGRVALGPGHVWPSPAHFQGLCCNEGLTDRPPRLQLLERKCQHDNPHRRSFFALDDVPRPPVPLFSPLD